MLPPVSFARLSFFLGSIFILLFTLEASSFFTSLSSTCNARKYRFQKLGESEWRATHLDHILLAELCISGSHILSRFGHPAQQTIA